MGRTTNASSVSKKTKPATTEEDRENQLIALATNLAEKQLREGTASSQVITHYLKLGSSKERLEKEIMMEQKKLVTAKTETLKEAKDIKSLYEKAIKSMRSYAGLEDESQEETEDEYY